MADGQPSFTAFTAAAARAAHLIVDDDPPIFADTLAEAMLGDRAEELIGYHRAHGTHPVLAGARAQVTCRSRYTEDSLADAARRGVGQYVVLGGFAPGTEVFVDYMLPAGWRDAAGDTYADLIGQASAERGEPWLSLFTPDTMADLLARHGFWAVRDVRQRAMIPAAAWDRSDSLGPAELSRIAHATMCRP
jgi:O-methyltransferase involved in polyketide biosynthesis